MKNIIILLLVYSTTNALTQTIKYEKVIQTDSIVTKENLFNRLSSRLIEVIGSQTKYEKNIIQSDKDLGVIKFKYYFVYDPEGNRSDDGIVNYNVNVFFKDGRFKIILNDIIHKGKGISLYEITNDIEYPHEKSSFMKFRRKAWVELKDYLDIRMYKEIELFEKIILKPTEQEKNW